MEIKEKSNINYITLSPVGELDANSSVHLDEKINKTIAEGNLNIHVDCSEVTYISSAGLGVFISYLDHLKSHNGKLVLSNLKPNVYDVFDLLGLNQLVEIVDSGEEIDQYFIAE